MDGRIRDRKRSRLLAFAAAASMVLALMAIVLGGGVDSPSEAYAKDGASESEAPLTNIQVSAQSEGDLTRAEWISRLVSTFDITILAGEEEYPDDYFEDVTADHEYFLDIMKATDFGVIDTPAGELFNPDEPATREFAAHTLNYCLGFQLDEGAVPVYSADETDYPEDMQVALDRGWFGGTKVAVSTYLATAEANRMISDAAAVLAETAELTQQASDVRLASNVKVVPVGTVYTIDAAADGDGDGVPDDVSDSSTITIVDCPISIAAGDLFAVYSGDVPVAFKAKSVSVLGNFTIIVIDDEADTSIAYESLVYSSEDEFDPADFQESEGVFTKLYDSLEAASADGAETGGLTTQGLAAQGISYKNDTLSYTKTVGATTVTGSIVGMKMNHSADMKKNHYYVSLAGTAVITATLSASTGDITMPLGVESIGVFTLSLNAGAYAEGSITVTTSANFEVGAEYSGGSIRMIKSFTKNNPGLEARATAGVYLEAAATAQAPGISAYLRARLGMEANYAYDQWTDGKRPYVCQDKEAHLFAGLYAKATLGFKPVTKSKSWSYMIWDAKNSPVRIHTHIEDGSTVDECTRGKKYPRGRWGIRWGGFGDGEGYGEGGPVEYAWYEYELDDKGNAVITKYHGNYRALIVPETLEGHKVTGIGEWSFEQNGYLTTVVIPEGITHIDMGAFGECPALSLVTIPASCKLLGHEAFRNCTSLTTVNIPKDVNEDENDSPFIGCESLQNVSFAAGTTYIPDALFRECGLEQIMIPDTVTRIGRDSFEKCEKLRTINWGKAIAEIGDGAFGECTALVSLDLPDTIKVLGNSAFRECTALTGVRLPKNVETGEFCGYFPGPFDGCQALKSVQFANGFTFLAAGLFMNCGLEEITIPETVTEIRGQAFDSCSQLRTVNWNKYLRTIQSDAFANCTALTSAVLPDSLTLLGCNAFHDCDALAEIYIPKNLNTGDNAGRWEYPGPFDECDGNAKVTIAEGLKRIPDALFWNYKGLTQVTIPSSVDTIGWMSFADAKSLKKIEVPSTVTRIEASAFAGSGLTEISLPDSVTFVGDSMFDECTDLAKVKLPSAISEITSCMLRKTAITEVTIPDTVELIEERAFEGCEGLATVNWGKSLTEMQWGVFKDCQALKSISIPATVLRMEQEIFNNCDSLTEATIPNSVIELGSQLFYDCDALTTVKLGTGIRRIGEEVFRSCDALTTIIVPCRVQSIDENAFADCVKLVNATIPQATTEIADNAFSYPSMMTVYGVTGTRAESWARENGARFVANTKPATSVSLDKTELTMYPDEEAYLAGDVQPADFAGTAAWKTSDSSIVSIDEETGRLYAESGGVATIEFSAGGKAAACRVSVVRAVEGVSVDPDECEVDCGDTVQLSAYVWPSDALDKSIEWSSSDTRLATVDQTGKVTTLAAGTVTITATAKDKGTQYGTSVITIMPKADPGTDPGTDPGADPDPGTDPGDDPGTPEEPVDIATASVATKQASYTYTGAALKPAVTVKLNGIVLKEDTDYELVYGKNVNVGTASFTVVGTGNYKGSKVGTFKITRAEIPVPAAATGLVYDGTVKTGVVVGKGYKVQGGSETAAGAYTATAIADANHAFPGGKVTAEISWSIGKAKPALTVKRGKNVSLVMGGKAVNLGVATNGKGALTYSSSNKKVATVNAQGVVTAKGAGKATIAVKAAETNNYSAINEKVSVTVKQGTQKLSFAKQTKTLKYAQVKKAKKTVAITKAKKAKTTVSYSITKALKGKKNAKKYFSIANKKTGTIAVKKGTPKGTYSITVKASAKKTANWKAASKSVVVTIKVK